MASNFDQARASNRIATNALAEKNRMKERAGTKDPGTDTSREVAARVKQSGDGPWGPNPDSIYGANSKR